MVLVFLKFAGDKFAKHRAEIQTLFVLKLNKYVSKILVTDGIVEAATSLCHADITKACENAIKHAILSDKKQVSSEILLAMLAERKAVSREGK
jgi:hypothetical protein